MKVLRFRDGNNNTGYVNGDIGRIETQQKLLKAIVEKLLTKVTEPSTILNLAGVFTENVTTDLTVQNIFWFGQQAVLGKPPLSIDNVNFVTMPCTNKSVWSRSFAGKSYQFQSYVVPNTEELVSVVNEYFNPYLEDLDDKDLDIMYVNSDGTIGSSTGVLEDTRHNSAWAAYKSTPKETPTPEVSETPELPERARKHRLPASRRTRAPPPLHLAEAAERPRHPRRHRPSGWRGPPTTSQRRLSPRLRLIPGRRAGPLRGSPSFEISDKERTPMTPKEMALVLAEALDSKKGQDIKVLETGALTTLADYFVICTATSTTQVKALADECEKVMKERGEAPHHIEGHRGGTWVLLDFSSVVVHLFMDEARQFYDLERLWKDAVDVDLSDILKPN